jgi:hypothetical protein
MAEPFDDDAEPRRRTFGDLRDDYDDDFGRVLTPYQEAQRRVRIPAIAFIVSGPLFIIGLIIGETALVLENLDRALDGRGSHVFNLVMGTAAVLLGLVVAILVIVAGVNMLQLRRWGLALAAAYFMTATSLGWCYGIPFYPFGIWALVVLYRPDVRQEFDAPPVQSQHDH